MRTSACLGYAAIASAIYTTLLAVFQFTSKSEAAWKLQAFSYASSLCLVIASMFCVALHFLPKLQSTCLCQAWFSGALMLYVLALFGMKFMFLERIRIFNAEPMFKSAPLQYYVQFLTASMPMCLLICAYLMVFHAYGECYADVAEFGCHTSFDAMNVYIAVAMIAVDTVHFGMFCLKWWNVVSRLKKPQCGRQIPSDMIDGFVVQFLCVVIAMLSCVVDGAVNLVFMNEFDTMLVFVVDCSIIATCNFALLRRRSVFSRSICSRSKSLGGASPTSPTSTATTYPGTCTTTHSPQSSFNVPIPGHPVPA